MKVIHLSPEDQRRIKCELTLKRLVKPALLNVLHNRYKDSSYKGLPENPEELYEFFNKDENVKLIESLKQNKVLTEVESSQLHPRNEKTDSADWEIPLILVVFKNFAIVPPPTADGWDGEIDKDNVTYAAGVLKAQRWRDRNYQINMKNIGFDEHFKEIMNILKCLRYPNLFLLDDILVSNFMIQLEKDNRQRLIRCMTDLGK